MADELEKLLAEGETTPAPASEAKPETAKPESEQTNVVSQKEAHLQNLNKAIEQANAELRIARKKAKALKQGKGEDEPEEELPRIDDSSPEVRAWDKRVAGRVDPLQEDMDKGREEVRTFALRKFLETKPATAADSEKVKELIATYEKLRTATERTVEGVTLDLERAYGAVYAQEILQAKTGKRRSVEAEAALAEVGVSRGATTYSDHADEGDEPQLTREDENVLAKWGMTKQEWVEMKKKQAAEAAKA